MHGGGVSRVSHFDPGAVRACSTGSKQSSGLSSCASRFGRVSAVMASWAIDFHTDFDMPDAVTLANLIEPLRPYFVEDLVRSENPGVYRNSADR